MRVLLIGSGGREHALAWKIAQSPLLSELWSIPGNPGIAQHAQCVAIDIQNHSAIIHFCQEKHIDLVVVGPELPLVNGISDALNAAGFKVFGPSQRAAKLESSKSFAKKFCTKYGIPTATYQHFSDPMKAKQYVQNKSMPIVVKADGLCAGKGVVVAATVDEATSAIDRCFQQINSTVIIEEYLEGFEVSFFALCDGKTAIPFTTARDHKRIHDGDIGPNTGGMGACSPALGMSQELYSTVIQKIILPTIEGMQKEQNPFQGVLFAGLMITEQGPYLIEYNVRFGDPECQAMMMRLESDILEILNSCVHGNLHNTHINWKAEYALTVVVATKGYPEEYPHGTIISKIPQNTGTTQLFHAGTAIVNNNLTANGGRVLSATALGKTITESRELAYHMVENIDWKHGYWREDIGLQKKERNVKYRNKS
ncbi:phosphoribosylamine--glycine ligase [Candidatus Liberibacter asiaticus]|uniref:Phosphoribosylamine--glycine ligase n=2 Tax=Liberibacter asiaticus TaxID=34021 RepID=C6XHD6_LIBAP|nr:phosphoribosylamine--glycine ligase [Candidatus Liberibacter asiaticus]ACT56679.1 phosphoribosylamine--glycine ligase [Candidatus Liberibacter asiaticus str. psy62]AGH16447.1 phosphoribosylamine--glycine ligase [Candidatus Liberibacter asiaticus str. gxpsy]ALK06858.1 phosphoribosylamine--glycine ligase [Candidatus Liberibacter asiaticus]ASK52326.1 phosphoribosylamine--glycine ligase [Candidatus Liberibacter asiaticus]AWL13648.1 phosphoribosylamine--glycine ligase [Candidatus Liberibacter as